MRGLRSVYEISTQRYTHQSHDKLSLASYDRGYLPSHDFATNLYSIPRDCHGIQLPRSIRTLSIPRNHCTSTFPQFTVLINLRMRELACLRAAALLRSAEGLRTPPTTSVPSATPTPNQSSINPQLILLRPLWCCSPSAYFGPWKKCHRLQVFPPFLRPGT